MADNFIANSGSGGATFASDDVGGIQFPRMKPTWGVDGVAGDISLANALPIQAGTGATFTIQGVQDTSTVGTITTATSVVGPLSVVQRNVITVSISGTYAGVTFIVEASDNGTNYYPLQCINNGTGQASATWTPGTNASASFDAAVGGYTSIQVRATAWTSGTANLRLTGQSFAYDPVVASLSQGLAATGTPPLGFPVLMAGFDATNVRSLLTDTTGRLLVAGGAASGATVAGNPVLMGGTFTTTLPTVTTGQAVNLQTTARGETLVALSSGAVAVAHKAASTAAAFTDPSLTVSVRPGEALLTASAALADALANPTLGQQAVLSSVFNGTTWDRQRGMSGNLTTGDTGAKTTTGNGATISNVGNKGVAVVVSMGVVSGTTPTAVLKLQGSADGGTTWYDIPGATTASLTATGVFGITVYPGITVTAGTTVSGTTAASNMPLPRTWRVVWTIGGTTPSFTITNVQYNYLPN